MNKELLKDIAKQSIKSKFDNKIKINKEKFLKEFSFLNEKRATFVTLTVNGELRGCIGSLVATKTLLDDLISNSYMAAFEDPRFLELRDEEFEKVDIEISLLTIPKKIEYSNFNDLKKQIIPNKHGVILEFKAKRSTFLPQVWEHLPNFDDFFSQLCYKGGFEVDENFRPDVYIYEVEKIK